MAIVIVLLPVICLAQGTYPTYAPQNWQTFKELENHLSDSTGYIGRMYEYIDQEMYFKDSNDRIQMFTDGTVWYPTEEGAIGDNVTDDTDAFNSIASKMESGDILRLQNKTYYINTANGITFNNRVWIQGPGTFRIGSGVGNAPAITIAGEKSYLSGFSTIGDHTNFTNANLNSVEFRRSIKVTGDYTICEQLKDTNSIVGIELYNVSFCTVNNCIMRNDIIQAGDGFNNYNVAIILSSCTDCRIINNNISGYGNGVGHGLSSFRNMINNNTFYRCDNNGIYVSSGQFIEVCGNIINESDGSGIKVRDSYHLVANNIIDQGDWEGGTNGISVTGNGDGDAEGFNGEQTVVIGNVITGNYVAAIGFGLQDTGYLRNPLVVGNTCEMANDPNRGNYGIRIKGRSRGAIIANNQINDAVFGIFLSPDDPNTDTHLNCLIQSNHIHASSEYAIILDYYVNSSIKDNIIYDSPRYAISITNADNLDISGNYIEDWYHSTSSHIAITLGGNNHTIKNNFFKRTNVGGICYGIRLENETDGVSIIGNTFEAVDYGLYWIVSDPNTAYHRHTTVANNYFIDSNYGGIVGSRLDTCIITGNSFLNAGEYPISLWDSNSITISDNNIKDTGETDHLLMKNGMLIKGNNYVVSDNYIESNSTTGTYGIAMNGDGSADANNYNGENFIVKGNHLIGSYNTAIGTFADASNYYVRNPKIMNNIIEITSGGYYGIKIDGRSQDAAIIDNHITGQAIGILVSTDDPNTDTHSRMLIKGNNICGGSGNGVALSYVMRSLITDNISMNNAAGSSGIGLTNCEYNHVVNNMCGDDQGTATQKYGIEELTSSDYNIYTDNDSTNVVTREYIITGDSSLVSTNRVVVETLSGNKTFVIGEAKTFFTDPGGAARTFNPIAVTWPMINELIVINTADAAETITFDSTGLNAAIPQNNRGIFAYDGANWYKIYIGS